MHKLDRFSRDRYDSAFYKRKLKEKGTRLISILENIDGSPESIILESVLEGMAEYYSKNLAREVAVREKSCTNKDSKKYIEDLVISYLSDDFFAKDNVRELSKRLIAFQESRKEGIGSELQTLKNELAQHEKEIKNIIKAVEQGAMRSWMIESGNKHDERIGYLKGKIEYIEGLQGISSLTE